MEYLLLSVLGALVYNLIFSILGIVAVIKANNGKSYIGWLIAGCIIQVPAFLGAYIQAADKGSSVLESETFIYNLIVFFVLLLLFILLCIRGKRIAMEEAANVAVKSGVPTGYKLEGANKRFVCEVCGGYSTGWYQKCPKCGAVGSMMRSAVTVETVPEEKSIKMSNTFKASELGVPKRIADIKTDGDRKPIYINISTLPARLRRAYIFLEDEEWDRADEYFEMVLDEEPENAYAYLGKALIEIGVDSPEHLSSVDISDLALNRNFQRAKLFADEELKKQIRLLQKE